MNSQLNCFITSQNESFIPIQPIVKANFENWLQQQTPFLQQWVKSSRFAAESGEICLVPNAQGLLATVLVAQTALEDFWAFGDLPNRLPPGKYTCSLLDKKAAIAWGLGSYCFTRYQTKRNRPAAGPQLFIPEQTNPILIQEIVGSIYLTRDLINTPTEDLTTTALADAALAVAKEYNCRTEIITGAELLKKGFPAIHAVGRGSIHPPCLVDFRWGKSTDPLVCIVGKGICFDSGGLNIKSPEGMRLMKKDMAGAAHALGLARLIFSMKLPLQLRVLLPIAENMISGDSYKPGDIIKTRSGLTVEITNTDAEGRVVMSDALTAAVEDNPKLLLDFASLTGAARIAVGPDIAAFFTSHEPLAEGMRAAAEQTGDAVWRLPLHQSYERYLKSEIADICNASSGPYAGAITAALFLKQFVPSKIPWGHFDVSAWNFDRLPGRPVGAEANGLRTVYSYLENFFM
ncbi:MAG: leucyl aminopeptidase family protein [Proteobacteria bacterium]|nr:leucyl aminopeptidase family protein [Pseudomonadota bacterium]